MTNFNIRVVGTANLTQMHAEFAKLQAQADALNARLRATGEAVQGVNPHGFQQMNKAVAQNSAIFRNAANSTGMWAAEQMRVTSATENYTRALEKQKLSFRDLIRNKSTAKAAYKEQLAMQQAFVRQMPGQRGGKSTLDFMVPTEVSKDLDTMGNKIGWIREQTRSASTQMINWGKNTQWAGRQLMVGFTLPFVALGAAAGITAYQVDKEMTRIRKVYDTTFDQNSTNVKEMSRVSNEFAKLNADAFNTARNAASAYGASIKDTLSVQADLAATGERGAALQGATTEVVKNAMLGEIDYQTATSATIALQQQLHLSNKDLGDSWAYMNSVENATSLGMKDFAAAIPIALGPIQQMGGSLQDLGTLMTAMVSRGVQVGKAANAIKALPQRLSRPSAQVQEEFMKLTGQDIVEMNKRNPDNIIGLLTEINNATKNLGKFDRRKALAGLFGSYQLSTMSAMLDGMQDLEDGTGQVTKAMEIAGQSTKKWRQVQEQEIGQWRKSISGQFKTAIASIQVELAELGTPFLIIATKIVKAVSWILEKFNNLPTGVKVGAIVAGGLMAMVGPLVMLTGLFANFTGNILKFGVSITGVLGKMEILNKESAATRLAASLAENGFISQASAANLNAKAIERLTLAFVAANRVQGQAPVLPSTGYQGKHNIVPTANPVLNNRVQGSQNPMILPQSALMLQTAGNQAAETSEKVKRNWGAVGGNIALAAGSMAMMNMSGDGAVSDLSKIVFYSTLLAPALLGAAKGMKALVASEALAANISKVGAGFTAAKTAAVGLAGALKSPPAGITRMAVLTGAARTGMVGMLGATGPLIAALAVAAGGAYLLHRHLQAGSRDIKEMYGDAEGLSKIIGYTATEPMVHEFDEAGNSLVSMGEKARQFREEYSYVTDEIRKARGEQAKLRIAMIQGQKVINTGGTAEQAKEAVRIALQAATDAQTAKTIMLHFKAQIDFTDVPAQVERLTKNAEKALSDAQTFDAGHWWSWDSDSKQMEQATQAGKDMALAYNTAVDAGLSTAEWQTSGKKKFEELNQAIADAPEGSTEQLRLQEEKRKFLLALVKGTVKNERQYVDSLKEGATWLDIIAGTTMKVDKGEVRRQKVMEQYNAALRAIGNGHGVLTKQQKLELLNQYRIEAHLKATGNILDGFGPATEPFIEGQAAAGREIDKNRTKAQALAAAMAFKPSFQQATSIMKDARTSFQQGIADATQAAFDRRANAAEAAVQAAGERRTNALEQRQERASQALSDRQENASNALEARQKRASDALEARQNRRQKAIASAYDSRIAAVNNQIKAEQKADDIRKRLFDAEMTRIDRLNEAQNKNIDFNIALKGGNLDEAAKIRNDMTAKANEYAMQDASAAGDVRSANRQDAMQARVDNMEKAKDKALERIALVEKRESAALDRRQAKQKKFLERRQRNEDNALKRSQERTKNALAKDVEATNNAEKAKWETRRTNLAASLKDFMGYVGITEKDLKAHIKRWEKMHGQMAGTTEGRFNTSSRNIEQYMKDHVLEAGRQIVNSNMWESGGEKMARSMIKGAFGLTLHQFQRWMVTGKFPDPKKPKKGAAGAGGTSQANKNERMLTRHEGGPIGGGGKDSRAGVARTTKGLHASEVMVRAQKGEYMVNRAATQKNKPLLDAINKGKTMVSASSPQNIGPRNAVGGGPLGVAGVMMGMMGAALKTTVAQGIQTGAEHARQMAIGSIGRAKAGEYGGRAYGAEQLGNAALIASVGKSMGMSARDIEIGIMTAITESGLVNIHGGDRDSQGLFQQRPSMGWGSVAQVTDPAYAARKFFAALRGQSDRASMSPWAAAQAVQRSGTRDGSNYKQYWDDAKGIWGGMTEGAGSASYAPGSGGWHRASVPGKGWVNSHDYRNGLHSPLFAVNDGRIIESRAIRSGGSGENKGAYPRGYSSYGVTAVLKTKGGDLIRYAHMWPGTNIGTGPVKGGTKIGESAATGNASGPHTHFEINGMEIAREWFQSHGIGLASGGFTTADGMANLHKDEVVISPEKTAKLYEGLDVFSAVMADMRRNALRSSFASGGTPQSPLSVSGDGGKAGDTVRTGTYNVLHTLPAKAVKGDLEKLMKEADVLSLTEYEGAARGLSGWIQKQGWGVKESVGHVADTAVIWNKKIYEALQTGTRSLNPDVHGTRGQRERFAAYALLRDKQSRREFWQVAAHTTNKASTHKAVQNAQWEGLNKLYADLKETGRPVFIAGDLNAPTARANQIAGGLKSNWTSGHQGQKATFKPHNSFVDHVMTNALAKLVGSKTMNLTSDHRALLTKYNIPALAKGGDIRWDNTLVNAHKGERMLTADLTSKLDQGIDRFANGDSSSYNVNVNLYGTTVTADEVAVKVDRNMRRKAMRLPRSRRG